MTNHLHAVIRPDSAELVGYELVFGSISGKGIPFSKIPNNSRLPKELKQLLHAPREDTITSSYHWEDYGTDHNYYEPTLVVHVASAGSNPIETIDNIFQRINNSIQNTTITLEDGVELYYAPPPKDDCDSLDPGAKEYFTGNVPLNFPNPNKTFPEEAKTIWAKLQEYTEVRKHKLEEHVKAYQQELNWLHKFNKQFP